jgi:hypothetical protein
MELVNAVIDMRMFMNCEFANDRSSFGYLGHRRNCLKWNSKHSPFFVRLLFMVMLTTSHIKINIGSSLLSLFQRVHDYFEIV